MCVSVCMRTPRARRGRGSADLPTSHLMQAFIFASPDGRTDGRTDGHAHASTHTHARLRARARTNGSVELRCVRSDGSCAVAIHAGARGQERAGSGVVCALCVPSGVCCALCGVCCVSSRARGVLNARASALVSFLSCI